MDKSFVLSEIEERIETLHERYRAAVQRDNAQQRTHCKRDIQILGLLKQLVEQVSAPRLELDSDAMDGLERLVSPNERHRRTSIT